MNKIILDQKDRVNKWIWKRVGRETPFEQFYAIGVERKGRLIAGVVFDSFASKTRCSMHCAGVEPNWCTRELLYHSFNYAFNVAECKVIINTVSSSNQSSIKFTKHIGFKQVGKPIKNGATDGDLVILAMHKKDCKWLKFGRN